MVVRASSQITLIDLTDGYSVFLTNDNTTFLGSTTSVEGTQTATTKIMALRGGDQIACTIGAISGLPSGISAVSDGKSPEPTITITATSALTSSGSFTIPILIGDITINKVFTWSIAFKGSTGVPGASVTVSSTAVTYQVSSSGVTAPTGSWVSSVPTVPDGQYLWTKTIVNYSDSKSTTAYSVSRSGTNGSNGTSVTVSSTSVTYQAGSSGVTTPTGSWVAAPPVVAEGQYLWTKTVVVYSDGKSTTSYSIGRIGTNGSDGEDGIVLAMDSSAGSIFRNTAIATTLTAHVYKGGLELTGAALTAEGAIKWYKDQGTTAVATGSTFTITAGQVLSQAVYIAKLEG